MTVSNQLINLNKKIHNKISEDYDSRHFEIFNFTEQKRLRASLANVRQNILTDNKNIRCLDFGSGTGNLTHLLKDISQEIFAFDVSETLLQNLEKRFQNQIKTVLVNDGKSYTKGFENSFDIVCTYSVLHHVPDYLEAVENLCLMTKPGGAIVIDHEVTNAYWDYSSLYASYASEMGMLDNYLYEIGVFQTSGIKRSLRHLINEIKQSFIRKYQIHKTPEFKHEGDIHTNRFDHIEWDKVHAILNKHCGSISKTEYLLCREAEESPVVWNKWNDKITDMCCLVGYKK